ncbi:MAG: hypothetical protein IBX72_08640 [Nitrospirae bacterium]|jgi:hypothetical protein|nr:hypothetical protein [Nitrospirota bacterium]
MSNYQVWWRGYDLHDVTAASKEEALNKIKGFYGVKRTPKDTVVVEIPPGYYDRMVKNNQKIGIDATNI